MDQIWSGINAAKVLLAEMTSRNPNVFYELGLAHALQKPVVLVSSNGDDVPFDLKHIRVIYYDVSDPFWGEKLIEKSLRTSYQLSRILKKPSLHARWRQNSSAAIVIISRVGQKWMNKRQLAAAFIVLLLCISRAHGEGAIAVGRSPERQWVGVTINKSTVQEARQAALENCTHHGSLCSVQTTFHNICAAIAWGERDGNPGRSGYAAVGSNIPDAHAAALSSCYSAGMIRCGIQWENCDTVGETTSARQLPISNKKAFSLGVIMVVAIFVVILKQGYPKLAGWTAIIMPAVSFAVYALFGIELRDEITLAEWPLFAPLIGGVLVAAISWRAHG